MIAPAQGEGASQCVCREVVVFAGQPGKRLLLQHVRANNAHAVPARASVRLLLFTVP